MAAVVTPTTTPERATDDSVGLNEAPNDPLATNSSRSGAVSSPEATDDHVGLHTHDDTGSPTVAAAAYRAFLAGNSDILLGPYGSGLVRHAAATVCGSLPAAVEPHVRRRQPHGRPPRPHEAQLDGLC